MDLLQQNSDPLNVINLSLSSVVKTICLEPGNMEKSPSSKHPWDAKICFNMKVLIEVQPLGFKTNTISLLILEPLFVPQDSMRSSKIIEHALRVLIK